MCINRRVIMCLSNLPGLRFRGRATIDADERIGNHENRDTRNPKKGAILTTLRFHLSRYLRRVTTVVVPSTGTSSAMVKWRPRTYASIMNFLTFSLALPSEISAKTSWKFWISASRPDSRTTRRFSLRHRNSKSRAKEGNLIKGALDDAGGNCLKSPKRPKCTGP